MTLYALDARKITTLTDGTTVTAANSASPDQFTPAILAPGTILWRASDAVGSGIPAHWEFSGSGIARGDLVVNSGSVAFALLAYLTPPGGGNNLILRAFSGSCAVVYNGTSGALEIRNQNDATLATSPVLPVNDFYRINFAVNKGTTTTNGTIRCELYLGANINGETPDWTYAGVGNVATGTANYTSLRIGKQTSGPIQTHRVVAARFSDSQSDFSGGIGAPFGGVSTRSAIGIQNNGTSSQIITKPANTADGDLLLAFHEGDDQPPTTITGTWTTIDSGNSPSAGVVQTKTYQRWAASEPANYTMNFGGAVDTAVGMMAISGADPSQVVTPTVATGTSTAMAAPSVAASKGDLLVCVWYIRSDATARAATTPGSMNKQIDVLGTWASLVVATEKVLADGPTGGRTATFPISASYRALSFVIHPVPTTQTLTDVLAMDAVAGMSIGAVREAMSVVGFGVSPSLSVDAVREQLSVLPVGASSSLAIAGVRSRVSVVPLAGVGSLSIKTSPIGDLLMGASSTLYLDDLSALFATWKASVVPGASLAGMFAQQGVIVLSGSSQAIWGPLRTQPAVLAVRATPTMTAKPGVVATVLARATPTLVLNSVQGYFRALAVAGVPRMVILTATVVADLHPSERVVAVILDGMFSAVLDLTEVGAGLLGDGEGLARITKGRLP